MSVMPMHPTQLGLCLFPGRIIVAQPSLVAFVIRGLLPSRYRLHEKASALDGLSLLAQPASDYRHRNASADRIH